MMLTFRTTYLIAIAVAVLTVTGCGPVLYYYFPQTRTYDYERVVALVVRSDPAGATVVTGDGTTVGQTPLILEERLRVRRTYHFHSTWLAVLGCIIDIGVGLPVLKHSSDSHSRQSGMIGLIGLGQFIGCIEFGFVKLVNMITKSIQSTDQQMPIFSTPNRIDEEVIPRPVELMARWDGLADTRATIVLPSTHMVTLRLPRKYTFDESMILWDRANALPLSPESLYQVGNAYRNLALQGVHGARERAVELFTQYLQSHATEHADDVHRALDELRQARYER